MAVSYVSTPYKSDPYVLPLGLNLLGKVLSIKQDKFDKEGEKIQQGINQLGALDIIRPQDKEYADQKINELVTGINSLGGVDLTDQNTASYLESLGSGVYNDPTVVNAVASTKSIRQLQSGYQKMKTDPKYSKMYSPVNEAWDMQAVNSYMDDPQLGASYRGSANPTPYVNYKENLIKNIQGTKANYKEIITPNGTLYYDKVTNERISPSRIIQEATMLSTPEEVSQMKRDGWFTYKDADKSSVVNAAIGNVSDRIYEAQEQLLEYKNLALQASNDPLAKSKYDLLVKKQEADIKTLKNAAGVNILSKKYDEDPIGFKQNVYMDQFYRGLGNKFAYNKTTHTLVENKAEMFRLRYQQQERFHSDEMAMRERELAARSNKGNGKKGQPGEGEVQLSVTDPNTEKATDLSPEEEFRNKNEEIVNENTALWQKFFSSWANSNPEVKKILQSQNSGSGITMSIQGQSAIEGFNGQYGLQIEDFNIPQGSENYEKAKSAGLTDQQINMIHSLYTQYEQLATGQDNGINKFPDGLESIVKQMQINNQAFKANQLKIEEVNKAALANLGITDPKDVKTALDYMKLTQDKKSDFNWTDYLTVPGIVKGATSGEINIISPWISLPLYGVKEVMEGKQKTHNEKIYDIVDSDKFKAEKKKFFEQVQNRSVYARPVLGDNYLGGKDLVSAQKLVSDVLYNQGSLNNSISAGTAIPSENIEVISAGRGFGASKYTLSANVKTGTGANQRNRRVVISLNPEQAKQFGFLDSPYERLNELVTLAGASDPMLVSANLNRQITGRKSPLRAKVVVYHKDPTSRTDFSSKAYVVDGEGNKIADIPGTDRERPDLAYAAAEAFIQMCENYGFTYDQMIEKIKNDSY